MFSPSEYDKLKSLLRNPEDVQDLISIVEKRVKKSTKEITDLKNVEKKIADLAKFPSENPNPVLRVNKKSVIYINQSGFKLLGVREGNEIPKSLFETVRKVYELNKSLNVENEINGRIFSFVVTPVMNKNYINIYGRDITKRKEAEQKLKILNRELESKIKERTQELKESEEKFRTITEKSLTGICILQDNVIKYVNQRFSYINGYSREEILNWKIEDINSTISPDSLEFASEQAKKKQMGLSDVISRYPIQVIKKNGEKIWIENFSKTINYEGRFADLVTIIDITDQKKSEEELRLHSEIMTNLAEGVYLIRVEDGIIVYANSRFEEMFGYDPGELIGKEVSIVNAPTEKTPEEIKEEIMGVLVEKGEWHGEIKNIKKDGTPIWCFANVSTFDHPKYGKVLVSVHTDITKRKLAEDELRSLNTKLENQIETRTLALNERVKELTCLYSLSQLTAREDLSMDELFYETLKLIPPAWQYPSLTCAKLLINGHLFHTENFIHTKWSLRAEIKEDLREVGYVEVFCLKEKPVLEDGPFLKEERDLINGIAEFLGRSIERKNADKKLQESESKLKGVISAIPDEIIMIDKENNIVFCNDLVNRTYGPNVVGKKCHEIFQGSKEICNHCHLNLTFSDGNIHEKESVRIDKEGKKRFYSCISNVTTVDSSGKPSLVLEVSREITEKKIAERKLKVSEERFRNLSNELEQKVEDRTLELKKSEEKVRNLINNLSDVLIETDPEGAITFISKQIITINGYQPEELINSIFFLHIHPEDRIFYQDTFKKSLNSQIPISLECRLKHKTGYFVPISIRGSFVKIKNSVKLYGVIRDKTEERKIENMIKKEMKTLKELDRIRSDLVTRMSHELKTPLISIFTGTEFLLNHSREQLNEDTISILSDIYDGGFRLKTMVENLLTVFEIDTDRIEFKPKKENLVSIIKKCIENIIFQANKRNIIINVELSENLFVDIDKRMIQSAIFNIISNAVKNTPSTGNVYISTLEHHNYVEVIIKDTGVGITKKEKIDLFKPFGKIERYGKGLDVDIEGPGLGLYIADEIIKLHQGELLLKSKGRNKGSIFTIRLNRHD